MSPEQATGSEVDGRSDQYALGVLFYEMLAGKPPFVGDTAMQIAFAHVHAPPPSLPSSYDFIEPLVMKMLAKDPKQRFPDLKAFVAELKGALVGSPVLQKRLKLDPNADISEQLKAIGFSEGQLSHRAPRAMIGVEVPQGALKHSLLEGSSLAAADLVEPTRYEKREVVRQEKGPMPMWMMAAIIAVFCAVAVGIVGLIF
jgi:serine/threonine protein kinase